MGERKGEKKGPIGEEPGENFTWGGLISKQSSNQIAISFPRHWSTSLHFNIKVADQDKAGGGHWGRREGKGREGQGSAGQGAPQ
jgi:hypothetical protein